ncbi:MAG: ATP-dependent zinc metalloprotease FtsH, partial [Clostridia bacterium]|nr:ATP-dependent zinc metalloprotease FtsH [Clostridia bacterium]
GGYTMSIPREDKSYTTKNDMIDNIVTLLGGRVAEKIVLGDISTGASNDIERSTSIARNMVTRYGMSDTLGPISFTSGSHEVFLGKDYGQTRNYSENVAGSIDSEIDAIITNAYNRCEKILTDNLDKLHKVAEYLIENEKMSGETFRQYMLGEEPKAEEVPAAPEEAAEENENA